MKDMKNKTILITGGAGFIGCHVVNRFVKRYPDSRIVVLDKLTYAGNLANLSAIEKASNYEFVKGDIVDGPAMRQLFLDYRFDGGWTAGVGAAWRVWRFRLSDTGPTPGGIGEERGVPVFLRVTRRFTDRLALHLYGGVVVAGQLRLEDASGRRLREEDYDPAPLFGATFVGSF